MYVNPIKLIEYLKEKQPAFIYETDERHDFAQLFSDKKVGIGALIILSMKKDSDYEQSKFVMPQRPDGMIQGHMLVCTGFSGQLNGKREPLYISFDNERKNYILSPKRQCGYLIDLQKIIKCAYESQERLFERNLKECEL